MAIVLQDDVLTYLSHSYVRQWIHTQGEVVTVVSLPPHTFAPYGTNPKTSLLFLKKYQHGKKALSGEPIFFTRMDDIGYVATGRLKGAPETNQVIFSSLKSEVGNGA